ncbi:MAG: endonuclease/exonuclease/phosphatase family protein [Verrucomicrobiaceae bacterium]|jgi:endonuclease/exonuclease/phosphatase family metal-dependent hydrolase|nr:endonuclease/exonuclease/phosphatase family protein [Verrucomicrobiaceae bacterium]
MKLATLILLGSVFSAAAQTPHTLRVLCYNIHYGQGMDGKYDVQRLAEVIKAAKPDLVALQEVDVGVKRSGRVHQVQKLGELTGLTARFGPTQHYEGGLFGNAVLTRLPILDELIQPLPYTEATPERQTYPRGALVITVQAPDGKPLRFISTHFQHNVAEDRVEEAKALNALFADPKGTPRTILAGDFNAKPDEEPISILEQHWTHAIDEARAPSAPSVNPKWRIDYIFYRAKADFSLVSSDVLPEQMASDHRPVLAVIGLR